MAFYKSKTRFETEKDGFHGVYWENKVESDCAIIMMLGDDSEDMMAKGVIYGLSHCVQESR